MTSITPPTSVTLTLATLTDLPFLTEIISQSYLPEPVAKFYLLAWPSLDAIRPYFTSRYTRRFAQYDDVPSDASLTQVFKLTHSETGEIVGTICLSEEMAEEVKVRDPKNLEGHEKPPEGINLAFATEIVKTLTPLENLMVGKRHILVTSFGVLPQYQGQGYGSLLLKKCNEVADERNLPLFLSAFPGAYGLYVKHGYEEISHADIDLAKWAKPFTGNGLYRSFAMLRAPFAGEA